MTTDLAGFGITQDSMREALEREEAAFLKRQGWTRNVLADYGLTIHPSTDVDDGLRAWHVKFSKSLETLAYVNIAFRGVGGEPLWCQPPRIGVPIPFRRVRLLGYRKQSGKYRQYAASGNRLFLPHDTARPDYWVDVANNFTEPVLVTEGEFDAISAHAHGLPCLAVTGIDCLRDKKTGLFAEPGEDFVWAGRGVYIIPDQDEESTTEEPIKQTVFEGLERMVTLFTARGARVKVVRLALTTVGRQNIGRKVGLSEYFALGGSPDEIWSSAVDATDMDMKLATMLREYSMYKGLVISNKTGELFKMHDFVNMKGNIFVTVGDKPRLVADMWKRSVLRTDVYDFVSDANEPYGPVPGTTDFNTWKGWPVEPQPLSHPDAELTIDYFEEWSQKMWGEHWPWVRGLIAHMMQHPDILRPHALVLCTPLKGVGKSSWFRLLGALVGRELYVAIKQDQFFNRFNDILRDRMVVLIDEANIFGHSEVRSLTDRVANPDFVVEGKGMKKYIAPWRGLICLTSNEPFAVKTTAQERRYMQSSTILEPEDVYEWQGVLSQVIIPWLFAEPEEVAGEEAYNEALRTRHGVLLAYFLSVGWEQDYNPYRPAPKSLSFLDSVEAAKSERTVEGEALYELLPDVFCIPGQFWKQTYSDNAVVKKYVYDEATKLCRGGSYATKLRVGPSTTSLTIYSKRDKLAYEVKSGRRWLSEENVWKDEGPCAMYDTLSDFVRDVLRATRDALTKYGTEDPWNKLL